MTPSSGRNFDIKLQGHSLRHATLGQNHRVSDNKTRENIETRLQYEDLSGISEKRVTDSG